MKENGNQILNTWIQMQEKNLKKKLRTSWKNKKHMRKLLKKLMTFRRNDTKWYEHISEYRIEINT